MLPKVFRDTASTSDPPIIYHSNNAHANHQYYAIRKGLPRPSHQSAKKSHVMSYLIPHRTTQQ